MNQDPVDIRLRALAWRRELTDSERAELRAWLATHPEALADWETEAALSRMLAQLPAAPVPSNFTARVLQSVERETRAGGATITPAQSWWKLLVPRAAVVTVIGLGLFGYHHHKVSRRVELANGLAPIANATAIPNSRTLEDFEAIRRLSSTPRVDEELLALMQ